VSKLIIALVAGTTALFASSAIAAPLNPTTTGVGNGVEKVRMVCDRAGRCWREGGSRRMIQRESYGYDRRRHRHDHDRGPSVGIRAPGVSIGIGDRR
jgi:hypothetical protein